MADVQLEHGHVRIANRLMEAILDAGFTGSQLKIVLALIRLTYGWRQKNVTIRVADLAAAVRLSPKGGFRRDLRELVDAGVIRLVREGGSGTPSTLALQKDYCQWGKFCVSEQRLAAVWGARYPSVDETTLPPGDPVGSPQPTVTPRTTHPQGSRVETLEGHESVPSRVTSSPDNNASANDLAARKDRTDRTDTATTTASRAGDADAQSTIAQTATTLTVTANRAIAARWGEQCNVLMHNAAGGRQVAEAVIADGIDVEFARRSIAGQCKRSQATRPPSSLRYFLPGIRDDWAAEEARRAAAAAPDLPELVANGAGPPTSLRANGARRRAPAQQYAPYDTSGNDNALRRLGLTPDEDST